MNVLKSFENDIENYQRGYEKACLALVSIQAGDLWVDGYHSFEDYCWIRWGFKKSRAYQLVQAGTFLLDLRESTTVENPPPNERICREILRVRAWEKVDGSYRVNEEKTKQKQIDTWQMVSSQYNGEAMIAEDVRVMVDKSSGRGINAGPSLDKRKKQALTQLGKAMDRFCAIRWSASEKKTYGKQVRERVKGW